MKEITIRKGENQEPTVYLEIKQIDIDTFQELLNTKGQPDKDGEKLILLEMSSSTNFMRQVDDLIKEMMGDKNWDHEIKLGRMFLEGEKDE